MHVIFDLDGTLTDSKPGIVASIRYALRRLDVALDPEVELESYIGPPLREVFTQICGPEIDVELAVRLYRERYADIGLFENSVYDGIEDCLAALGGEIESLYVATSKPTIYAERIVEHFGLDGHFAAVYGASLDGSLGNKAELLTHLLAREKLDPARCYMVGDRHYDMVGAQRNGLRAIGVLWGYGSEAELLTAGAHSLCRHPRQILRRVASA